MAHRVTLLPGDTTGPEIVAAVRTVIDDLVDIDWDVQALTEGEITDAVLSSIRRNGTALMAYHQGRRDQGVPAPIVQLRKKLGVFANVRPVHSLPGLSERFEPFDIVVVRETTEDIYAHLEHESIPNVFESLKVTTRAACERIARHAFEYAREHGRRKVTIVHKSNIMKKSDGMFLRTAQEVAADYPDIAVEDQIVDALCMKIIIDPRQYDVLLCGNLFGDIVADVCAGIGGGASNCPSANLGADGVAVFGAPHGDPADLVKTGRANPLPVLLPAVLMLRHLGEGEAADRLMKAIEATLSAGVRPMALGGEATCEAFTAAVRQRV